MDTQFEVAWSIHTGIPKSRDGGVERQEQLDWVMDTKGERIERYW